MLVSCQINEFISPNWNETYNVSSSSKRMVSQRKLSNVHTNSNSNIDTGSTSKRKNIDTQINSPVSSASSAHHSPIHENGGVRLFKPDSTSDVKRNNFMDPDDMGTKSGTSGIGVSSRQRRRDLILECRKLRNEVSYIWFTSIYT